MTGLCDSAADRESASGSGSFRQRLADGELFEVDPFGLEHAHDFFEGQDESRRRNGCFVRLASSFLAAHGPMNTTLAFGFSFLISRPVSTIGVSAMEMYGLKSGDSFLAMTDHAGQQEVAMNGCFSGTLSRKSSASSMVHRSAPMATSTTSAKPSSFQGALDLVRRHARAELSDERRRDGRDDLMAVLDGVDRLEDLALVDDGAERTVDQAHAAGDALVVVDLRAAVLVGMDGIHAAAGCARALQLVDGVVRAGLHAASALDALVLIDLALCR